MLRRFGGCSVGACRALLMTSDGIPEWACTMRAASNGASQMNIRMPDSSAPCDATSQARQRLFLADWGADVAPEKKGEAMQLDFEE